MSYSPYVNPEAYEVAFSFRDYVQAVDFIIEACRAAGRKQVESIVELGCGPGQYCREFARRGVKSCGVDLSPEMVAYTSAKCAEEKLDCPIIEADFRHFTLDQPVDLALTMMATFGYLLSNDDIVEHFNTVANNLTDDGLYMIELPHPRDVFDSQRGSTTNVWEIEKDGMKVHTDWALDAVLDPLTGIDSGTVRIQWAKGDDSGLIESSDHMRRLSFGLMRSLIKLSGRFTIVGKYGDLNINQPFDNNKKSWRMILLLRRIG